MRAVLAGGMLLLAGCGELPLPVLGTDGLSPASGWVVAPTDRWLTEPGLRPEALVFCAVDSCVDQVLVARFALEGREREIGQRIADDPERVFAHLPPSRRTSRGHARRPNADRPTAASLRISRLRTGAWSGARITLASQNRDGRAAHLVVLARPRDNRLLMVVASDAERAEEAARAAAR